MPSTNMYYTNVNFAMSVILIVILFACSGQVNQTDNKTTTSSTQKVILEKSIDVDKKENQYQNGLKEGIWRDYHKNGQLKSEGSYVGGQKEGLHREWETTGILLLEGYYKNDKADGWMKWFHDKGHLAAEGNMIQDLREGPWKICDIQENGFCIDAHFVDGKRDGVWKIYHEDAMDKVSREQTFESDRMISEKCFDKSGIQINCK